MKRWQLAEPPQDLSHVGFLASVVAAADGTVSISFLYQDEQQLPLKNVHLIGYSLGAHVAGHAGTHVRGTIGRITGEFCAAQIRKEKDSSCSFH